MKFGKEHNIMALGKNKDSTIVFLSWNSLRMLGDNLDHIVFLHYGAVDVYHVQLEQFSEL